MMNDLVRAGIPVVVGLSIGWFMSCELEKHKFIYFMAGFIYGFIVGWITTSSKMS